MKRSRWPLRRSRLNQVGKPRSFKLDGCRKTPSGETVTANIRNFRGPWPDYDHAAHMRSLPCAAESRDCRGRIEAAHEKSRKMGGADGDWTHLVHLCRWHHRIFDRECANDPVRFEERFGVDLTAVAAERAEEARKKHA